MCADYPIVFVEEVTCRIADLWEKIWSRTYTYEERKGLKSDVWDVFYNILDESGREICRTVFLLHQVLGNRIYSIWRLDHAIVMAFMRWCTFCS